MKDVTDTHLEIEFVGANDLSLSGSVDCNRFDITLGGVYFGDGNHSERCCGTKLRWAWLNCDTSRLKYLGPESTAVIIIASDYYPCPAAPWL